MKTKQEIENRLYEAKDQLELLKEWQLKAESKYKSDKDWWGEDADDGELRQISSHIGQCLEEIAILKWVLS